MIECGEQNDGSAPFFLFPRIFLYLLALLSPSVNSLFHNVKRMAGVLPPSYFSCYLALLKLTIK